jgi:hypothetical protein
MQYTRTQIQELIDQIYDAGDGPLLRAEKLRQILSALADASFQFNDNFNGNRTVTRAGLPQLNVGGTSLKVNPVLSISS